MDRLDSQTDYAEAMKIVTEPDLISSTRDRFEGMNPKILLTAFLIKNFPQEMDIPGDHALTDLAKGVVKAILEEDMDTLGTVYPRFFEDFNKWRLHDIHLLKSQITHMSTELDAARAPDVKDEADKQWNDGINMSQKVLSTAVDQLDRFATSPPKFN